LALQGMLAGETAKVTAAIHCWDKPQTAAAGAVDGAAAAAVAPMVAVACASAALHGILHTWTTSSMLLLRQQTRACHLQLQQYIALQPLPQLRTSFLTVLRSKNGPSGKGKPVMLK
jgi:hypothetical protein